MNKTSEKIIAFILKERNIWIHIIATIFTFGLWAILYWIIKILYGNKVNKDIDTKIDFKEAVSNGFNKIKESTKQTIAENKKWSNIIVGKISVNEIDKKVKIFNNVYNYSDIIDCELLEDGTTITKASTLGTIGRGIVGGEIFGVAGAIVGGTTSARKNKDYCTRLEVKITVNNIKNPCIICKFITKKAKKTSNEYKNAFNDAQNCLSLIQVIINNK